MPVQLITLLGPKTKQELRETVSRITTASSVPEQWRLGRMTWIYKGRDDKYDIKSYRLITITSVVYKIAMQFVKKRMEAWEEGVWRATKWF